MCGSVYFPLRITKSALPFVALRISFSNTAAIRNNYFSINFVDSGLEAWKVAMAVVIPVVLVILLAIVGVIAYLKYGKKRNNSRESYKPGYVSAVNSQTQIHFNSVPKLLSIISSFPDAGPQIENQSRWSAHLLWRRKLLLSGVPFLSQPGHCGRFQSTKY